MHGHVHSRWIFVKKANHYNNFNCYTRGFAKTVVDTPENLAGPYYDANKMAAILNVIENLLCIIIFLILGQFLNLRCQNVHYKNNCLLISEIKCGRPK